MENCRTLRAKT